MRFAQQKWFSNDVTLMPTTRLELILGQAHDLARNRPVLSGLEDLAESLSITYEYMRSHIPSVQYKELRRAETGLRIDPLYNEPGDSSVQGREFTRSVWLHAHTTYNDPQIKLDKPGQNYDQPLTVYLSLLDLYANDYYPEVGDEVIYMGRAYQLTTVFFPVNALFLHTGMPLYVAQTAEIWRHGDTGGPDSSKIPDSLANHGLPRPVNPQVDPARQALENRVRARTVYNDDRPR